MKEDGKGGFRKQQEYPRKDDFGRKPGSVQTAGPTAGFRMRRGNPAMQLAMAIPTEKPKDFSGTLRKLAAKLRPHVFALIVVVLLAVLGTLFGILSPRILGNIISDLFESMLPMPGSADVPGIDYRQLLSMLAKLGTLYLASGLFTFLMQYLMVGITQRIVFSLRSDVREKLNHLPLSFYDCRSHGDIISRVTNDIDLISTSLQQSLIQVITSLVALTGTVIMMLLISPLLTLAAMLTLPLSLVSIKVVTSRSRRYFTEQQKVLGELNGHIEEMFSGHREVKAFNREKASIARFGEMNDRLYDAGRKAQFISGIIMPLMHAVSSIGFVLISVLGGLMTIRGRMRIGDVQAFILYVRQLSQPIQQTAAIANLIQGTIAAAERVFELLEEEEQIPDPILPILPTVSEGKVVLEEVDFRYRPDIPLIERLSLTVPAGSSIAIVGPTGAGKTTLVNLLMRFYEIHRGTIRVDGIDACRMRRGDLRRMFGMVLQDTWLFQGTIRENIAFGKTGAEDSDIFAVAEAAHADHFIRTLPDGYETILTEGGSNLSLGQRQLLTIARAFLADPAILILDEATSSVDTRTELLIQHAMTALMRGRTNFIIAHRLSTIRDAGLILVMEHGSIVEQGTHGTLLSAGGLYASMYRSQFEQGVAAD